MKKLLFPLILMFSLFAFPTYLNSAVNVTAIESEKKPPQIKSLKVKDVEKMLGRKMTLKEKIQFSITKIIAFAESGNTGQTAMIFGIAGAALFIIGLFVPYVAIGALIAAIVAVVLGSVAKKRNPDDRKAHAAKLLGWITIGALAFLIILAAIVLSSWGL
jgi:uncharacterized membrane protein YphA (DoxX/SURF4 family)